MLACFAMVILMMMTGLGVDVGYLRYQKQQMQKAADAGALAAASALIYSPLPSNAYVNAATNDTAANGFTANQVVVNGFCSPSGTNICVAVNSPPLTVGDPFYGQAGYVEVIVTQARPTFFMPVAGFSSVNVSSRGVASSVSNGSGCAYALDSNPGDTGTLTIDAGVFVGAPSCAMYVESSNTGAFSVGTGGGANGSYIGLVASQYSGPQVGCEWNLPNTPCPLTNMAQFQDPLMNVPAPTPATGCTQPSGTYYPAGTYCSGISIIGPGNYTFGPGLITVEGAMIVAGNSSGYPTITSNSGGTLFYLTGNASSPYAGLNINSGANIQLTPQTTGAQAGILFFQDRSVPVIGSPASSFNGNGSVSGNDYSGAFYFPTTKLSYAGEVDPSLANSVILDAWQIEFTGNATINAGVLGTGLSNLRSAIPVE